ncbi:heat-inducible transcriptional repressor HrcA, partial [Simkania negevensis]|nr:heat-inducible transcriptional repressor HrcA [Simkania negevensis]
FSSEDVYSCGFSRLFAFPEFSDALALSNALALFENHRAMLSIAGECTKADDLSYWIGSDLVKFLRGMEGCSVVAIPYHINMSPVGVLGVLGPTRLPYRRVFGLLEGASKLIGESLTTSVFKHKLSYRRPCRESLDVDSRAGYLVDHTAHALLEHKSHTNSKENG